MGLPTRIFGDTCTTSSIATLTDNSTYLSLEFKVQVSMFRSTFLTLLRVVLISYVHYGWIQHLTSKNILRFVYSSVQSDYAISRTWFCLLGHPVFQRASWEWPGEKASSSYISTLPVNTQDFQIKRQHQFTLQRSRCVMANNNMTLLI